MIYFNSHAHVERDLTSQIATWSASSISTHTLTWSVTNPVNDDIVFNGDFNSHAHVERDEMGLGKISNIKHFNSHAHVERDVAVQKSIHYLRNFNSHAHVERDSQLSVKISGAVISTHTLTWSVTNLQTVTARTRDISTHTLTWSVTHLLYVPTHLKKFQLTRSRGA